MQASGLQALTNDAGLAVLDQLMAGARGARRRAASRRPRSLYRGAGYRGAASGVGARQAVRSLLAEQLRIPAGDIADDAPFGTLGLKSLHLQGFARVLEERFGVPMPVTELFRANTGAGAG